MTAQAFYNDIHCTARTGPEVASVRQAGNRQLDPRLKGELQQHNRS